MRLGPVEIGLILVIVLIVFGVGKLPQVGGALGKGIREFREAVKGEDTSTKPTETRTMETRVSESKDTKA